MAQTMAGEWSQCGSKMRSCRTLEHSASRQTLSSPNPAFSDCSRQLFCYASEYFVFLDSTQRNACMCVTIVLVANIVISCLHSTPRQVWFGNATALVGSWLSGAFVDKHEDYGTWFGGYGQVSQVSLSNKAARDVVETQDAETGVRSFQRASPTFFAIEQRWRIHQ